MLTQTAGTLAQPIDLSQYTDAKHYRIPAADGTRAYYASGGMVLSGDDLTKLPPARAAMLKKLLPPTGVAAAFPDDTLRIGTVTLPHARMWCLFNWDDQPQTLAFRLPMVAELTDYWSDASMGRQSGAVSIEMAPRSARLLKEVS